VAAALGSPALSTRLLTGIGDDASVVRSGGEVCVTSIDTIVEGVHFMPLAEGWHDPSEIGHRALAGALSDLAAMGAAPGEAYISLGLPAGFSEQDALALMTGADSLAQLVGAAIAGGDVVAAPVLTVSVAVTGWAQGPQELVSRKGARSGELVGVTGRLGAARAALAVLQGRAARSPAAAPALARAAHPLPRLTEGQALAAAGVTAMIDISDGLVADAAQLGRASGVDLRVSLQALPVADGVAAVAAALDLDPAILAAEGGEDYELCFSAPEAARTAIEHAVAAQGSAGAGVTWVGEVCEGVPGATLLGRRGDVVRAEGFEHRW
jgi:thiamine-monophosphate kinase